MSDSIYVKLLIVDQIVR